MSSSYTLPAALEPTPAPREAVADAMYRCALGFDTNDESLFDSSFMPDAVFEINGITKTGLPEIHSTWLTQVFRVDTTHMVTNMRVHIPTETSGQESGGKNGTLAQLTATVLSQHFALGKGLEPGQKYLLAGSLYHGELVEDVDGLWKFSKLRAKPLWMDGDYTVITDAQAE